MATDMERILHGSDWFMYTFLGRPTHALLYIGLALARAETYGRSLVPRPIFRFVTDPEELPCARSSYFNQQCHSQLAVNESLKTTHQKLQDIVWELNEVFDTSIVLWKR